ncbi:MFS transporter [Arthrobacter woluwensis]|uniref:Predicted arabinose efflux permease, MFS family n=1 Tax=Arthrobacter woluwensis TaxID=156980 RepID=A0A1H4JVD5_9MICC|nr:MFS transporter [Arthrobacter woluwensis]SEB50239.1 Predicted arabinose efflux permease, MFS family [Arthrobacter woluwensis]
MSSRMFQSLKNPNYRLWAAGALVSNIGTWMQRVAQDWLVLTQLTDHDGAAVGLTTGLQFLPILLLGPYAGLLGDRLDKRKILLTTQTAMGLLALLQAVLVLTGTAQLWHIYVIALALGVASAFDAPPRQAFVSEIVGRENVANAVALNSASFNLARLAGPGIAGLLIGLIGTGWVFLLNATSFAAVLIGILRMNTKTLHRSAPVPRGRGQLKDGVKYVLARPRALLVMVLAGLVGTFTMNFQLTNAVMAASVFDAGPDAYGLLGSVMAVGTLAGALLAARRAAPRLRYLVMGAIGLGVTTCVAAFMPGYTLYAIMLVLVGLCALTFLNSANTLLQMRTEPAYRGRVLALYMTVIQGGTPIGGPLVGWIANEFGPRWAVFGGGAVALLAGLAGLLLVSRWGEGTVRKQLRHVWAEHRELREQNARERGSGEPSPTQKAVGAEG